MDIRLYTLADRDSCLEIFDSIPSLSGRPLFVEFLDGHLAPFFVAEHNETIVGCGGYSIQGSGARLHWGIVHSKWQRQGLGRFLLFYRLKEITKNASVEMVALETPRPSALFFVSQGFREVSGNDDAVEMVKRLTVCA